jgi:hypothetical protein
LIGCQDDDDDEEAKQNLSVIISSIGPRRNCGHFENQQVCLFLHFSRFNIFSCDAVLNVRVWVVKRWQTILRRTTAKTQKLG